MNLANRLTLARVALTPVFMWMYLWDFPYHYLVALGVFALAALTDYFDGVVARSRGQVTVFGKFVDPIADKMLTTAAFIGLMKADLLSPWALLLILVREFAVASVRMVAAGGGKVIAANFFGKFKTVSQYVAVMVSLAALAWVACSGDPGLTWPLTVSKVLLWTAALLTVASGIEYLWANRSFLREK